MTCAVSDRGCTIVQDLKIDFEKQKTTEEICRDDISKHKDEAWKAIGDLRNTVNSLAVKIALMTGAINLIGLIVIKFIK